MFQKYPAEYHNKYHSGIPKYTCQCIVVRCGYRCQKYGRYIERSEEIDFCRTVPLRTYCVEVQFPFLYISYKYKYVQK